MEEAGEEVAGQSCESVWRGWGQSVDLLLERWGPTESCHVLPEGSPRDPSSCCRKGEGGWGLAAKPGGMAFLRVDALRAGLLGVTPFSHTQSWSWRELWPPVCSSRGSSSP